MLSIGEEGSKLRKRAQTLQTEMNGLAMVTEGHGNITVNRARWKSRFHAHFI